MIKRDELTDPGSCMSRARDDEMTFVLLGRDPAFAAAVRFWVRERVRLGKNRPGDPQVREALDCAARVEAEHHPARSNHRSGGEAPDPSTVCPGHGPRGTGPACCGRAGDYNGYGSDGPTLFTCPRRCSCHD